MKHLILFALCPAMVLAPWACTSSSGPDQTAAAPTSIRGSCIDPRQIDSQKIVSDQEIQFTLKNGEVWTNTLPTRCTGMKLEGGFSWDVRGTLVCSNQQTITVKHAGTCLLGPFTKAS